MSVSLRAMTYFCTALRSGSISAAAAELNVAASAIAAAIDQIEAQFQLSLTIRQRSRGIEATADGRVMAERFQALLDEYEAVLRDGAERRHSLSGELRVGYYAPVAPAFLPEILSGFVSPEDDLTLVLEACDNAQAQDGLRGGAYDAILFVAEGAEPAIETQALITARPYCLLAVDHPLASSSSVALSDLAAERIVQLDRPFVTDYYRALFEHAGAVPRRVIYTNSTEMVRSLVGALGACAILNMLPLTDVSYAGDRVVARPITDALPPLTLSVAYRRGPQRRAVTAFVAACTAFFENPGPVVIPTH